MAPVADAAYIERALVLSQLHVLTIDEAAEFCRCSRSSIRRAIDRGDLRSRKMGGRVIISRAAIDEFLMGDE